MAQFANITYTQHALERMNQRRISHQQVEATLEYPDKTYPSRGKLIAEKMTVHGNTLRVVYSETSNGFKVSTAVVITVMRISP